MVQNTLFIFHFLLAYQFDKWYFISLFHTNEVFLFVSYIGCNALIESQIYMRKCSSNVAEVFHTFIHYSAWNCIEYNITQCSSFCLIAR
ncbi:tRNA-dihydrouridine(47) synthase [Dirofilaria immitis]